MTDKNFELMEIKGIPKKRLKINTYLTILEEFSRSKFRFAELKMESNSKPKTIQMLMRRRIKAHGYNISAHARNDKIYLEKIPERDKIEQ